MARWGSADYRQLVKLRDKVEQLASVDMDVFCRTVAKEIAARVIRSVKYRTPVISGDLRRGWRTDGNVTYNGKEYRIYVYNAEKYSFYVEYGHRTRGHNGWVKGRFMLTITENEFNSGKADAIIEKRLVKKLSEVLK